MSFHLLHLGDVGTEVGHGDGREARAREEGAQHVRLRQRDAREHEGLDDPEADS